MNLIRRFVVALCLLLGSSISADAAKPSQQTEPKTSPELIEGSTALSGDQETFSSSPLQSELVELDATDLSNFSTIVVPRISGKFDIRIDGHIDEELWSQVPFFDRFVLTDPDTFEPATERTAVRMFYNDSGLYLSAVMGQDPATLVKRLSARDEGFLNRDYFSFNLDTSGEGKYGFWFQLNLGDSRADGTVKPERQFSDNWDGAWYGATQETVTGWSAEFFIPWSVVSMPKAEGARQMGIYMSRKVAFRDERHGWPALSFTQPKFLSAFQPLVFEKVSPRRQLSFFPYVSSLYNNMTGDANGNYGTDFFWRPSTNFQVTAALKPDFGTVEADRIVVNLTAIETFFPEKRLFFLEGQEIFSMSNRSSSYSSNSTVTLLHTRRIGERAIRPELPEGSQFSWSDFSRPSELLGAVKATGTSGDFSYGVLSATEEDSTYHGTLNGEPLTLHQSGRDFNVVRGLWEKSNGNYRGFGFMSTQMAHETGNVHTHGIDGHFFSADGKFKIDSKIVVSDIPDTPTGYGGLVDVVYAPAKGVTHEFVFEDFDDHIDLRHMGYLSRNNIQSVKYRYRWRKSSDGFFREQYTRLSMGSSWNGNSELVDQGMFLSHRFTFQNLSQVRLTGSYEPDQYDDRNSFGFGTYALDSRRGLNFEYSSDNSKRFYYMLGGGWMDENTEGDVLNSMVVLVYRPSDRLSMFMNLSYTNRDAWLLHRGDGNFTTYASESWGPRFAFNYFIDAKQYIRFDLQWRGIRSIESGYYELPDDSKDLQAWTEQKPSADAGFSISRMNVQLRYRWEIAPMSDLYVVYTKNSNLPDAHGRSFGDKFTETFSHPTDEAFIVKLRHRIGV